MKRFLKLEFIRLLGAFLLLILGIGFGGIVLHWLFDRVEELLWYGYLAHRFALLNRWVIVTMTGIFSACLWFVLQRDCKPMPSVKTQLLASKEPKCFPYLCHIIWQIVSVAAGSPIGKEGAPREFGALLAGQLSKRFSLSAANRQLLLASGAAAGLAAIYQVPLAATFFAFESLGLSLTLKNTSFTLVMILLSSQLAQLSISTTALYQVPLLTLDFSVFVCAIILGVLLTPMALLFSRCVTYAEGHRNMEKSLLWQLPLVFIGLACLSLVFPELLGNGSALAQSVFDGIKFDRALALVVLKAVCVIGVLRTGAYGGVLTPSFAIGVTVGFLLAPFLPFVSASAVMLISSSVFLAISLRAPLSAIALALSFTGQPIIISLPLLLAVAVSSLVMKGIKKLKIIEDIN